MTGDKDFRQVVRGGQIADERETVFLRHDGERRPAGSQHHGRADIARDIKHLPAAGFQQFQQAGVFLSAAATEADDVNALRLDLRHRRLETLLVNGPAIRIVARGRIRLVQGEPFLGLPDAVVVELVVHAPRTERVEQIAPDVFRKLAGVNRDIGGDDMNLFSLIWESKNKLKLELQLICGKIR